MLSFLIMVTLLCIRIPPSCKKEKNNTHIHFISMSMFVDDISRMKLKGCGQYKLSHVIHAALVNVHLTHPALVYK